MNALNHFFGLPCKEEEDKCKEKVMQMSGIKQEYLTYKNVPTINNEFIHVYIIDDKSITNKVSLTHSSQ